MKKIPLVLIALFSVVAVLFMFGCPTGTDPAGTDAPTVAPTNAATDAPTEAPTQAPTEAPTQAPTEAPTQAPTDAPTEAPTQAPTEAPTEAPTQAPNITWAAWDGSVLPSANTPAFTFTDSTAVETEACMTVADGIATFASLAAGKPYWQLDYIIPAGDTYPKTFTWIARMQNSNGANRGFEIEICDISGYREKFILRETSKGHVEIEKADGSDPSTLTAAVTVTDYHIYQFSITYTTASTGTLNLYIDGATTPAITHTGTLRSSTTAPANTYIRIGENGSKMYNANVDWIVWTNEGAYAPADVTGTLPAGLGDTTGY